VYSQSVDDELAACDMHLVIGLAQRHFQHCHLKHVYATDFSTCGPILAVSACQTGNSGAFQA
jgi:hypothetical protein